MLKKRILFTLLYDGGSFVLSRNFRLQKVGAIDWLQENYNFSQISYYIDELVVLDVTRSGRDILRFGEVLKSLAKGCFAPIAAGGGIAELGDAQHLLRAGADKIVVNSALFHDALFVKNLAHKFGQQCVVGSIDVKQNAQGSYSVFTNNGERLICGDVSELITQMPLDSVGEIYLNSINRDGTGQGYDHGLLELVPAGFGLPIILAGGAGHSEHMLSGLLNSRVDAVASAHLFNFVGDGLKNARAKVIENGVHLADWPSLTEFEKSLGSADGVA